METRVVTVDSAGASKLLPDLWGENSVELAVKGVL